MQLTPLSLLRVILAGLMFLASSASAYTGEGTAYGSAGGRGSGVSLPSCCMPMLSAASPSCKQAYCAVRHSPA
jgi:hypothetical protein